MDESSCMKIHTTEHMQMPTFNSRKGLQMLFLVSKRTSSIAMRTKIEVHLPEAHSNAWNIFLSPALHLPSTAETLRIYLYNFCHVNLPFGNSKQSIWSRPLHIPSFTPDKLLKNKRLSNKIKQGYLSVQDRKYRQLPYATLKKGGNIQTGVWPRH